jgi:hypothetical protein
MSEKTATAIALWAAAWASDCGLAKISGPATKLFLTQCWGRARRMRAGIMPVARDYTSPGGGPRIPW